MFVFPFFFLILYENLLKVRPSSAFERGTKIQFVERRGISSKRPMMKDKRGTV